ncbi:MAG: hypothetical protein KGI54_05810 [Pseudomonadota bacterium]|nr:hypothetical protein [Pseudomonadota bacterium]
MKKSFLIMAVLLSISVNANAADYYSQMLGTMIGSALGSRLGGNNSYYGPMLGSALGGMAAQYVSNRMADSSQNVQSVQQQVGYESVGQVTYGPTTYYNGYGPGDQK